MEKEINSHQGYKVAKKKLAEMLHELRDSTQRFRDAGLSNDKMNTLLKEGTLIAAKLADQVTAYEQSIDAVMDAINKGHSLPLIELGKTLVHLRLISGVSVVDLAQALKVDRATVSRNERKGYANMTLAKINRIAEVLGYKVMVNIKMEG